MEVREVKINQGEWLTEVYKREEFPLNAIPTNCILDKTVCGLGATHSELDAKRNSIIIEPNVPVIKGKTEGKPQWLGVFEGKKEPTIKKYLLNEEVEFKKILCTPESYPKVLSIAKKIDKNLLYDNYFCLYDECEKIVQDIDYRDTIDLPMIDFFDYRQKAFVSATPLEMRNPGFKENDFFKLKVVPTYNYLKNIDLIVTNRYNDVVIQKLEELKDSKCICVFLNSTNGINRIVTHLKENGIADYKTFSSRKSVMKFKDKGITQSYEDIDLPLAKYNFFTSRFFSAVDIKIDKKPDILILTNLHEATYTEIDPFTSAIQLCGRFRTKKSGEKNFNSLTHITNVDYYKEEDILSEHDIDLYIDEAKKKYHQLKEELEQATEKGRKRLFEDSIKKSAYKRFIYTDEKENIIAINYFAIDNFYDDQRVKSYYLSAENLLQAYKNTGHFNPTLTIYEDSVSESTILKYAKLRTDKESREYIVNILDSLIEAHGENSKEVEYAKSQFRKDDSRNKVENADYIIDAIEKIGTKPLKETDYTKTAIDKLLKEYRQITNERKMFSPEVKQAIEQKIPAGEYSEEQLLKGIEEIFGYNGIDLKVGYPTIKKYFEHRKLKGKKEGTIQIIRFAPEDEYK